MPRRTDLSHVLVIGSGPIVIGQACEFDYSGTQACRVLRADGLRVTLVNSNPATIMTDPEFADATYIEPITPEFVELVIAKERPDALLATLGGRTAGSPRPPCTRCSSRRACSAGRSTSSNSCATGGTTWSWSAPSRTSTRWACTPAIPSPWRRR